ncbi:hypothetical protein [Nocardioides sp.]|uniref:hypothetical protein n=1 Tax=Nocardioides sp. TaxID=35761 RepID=UPI0035692683
MSMNDPAAPPPAPPYNVGNALSYGWAKFQKNAVPIVLAALVVVAGLAVLSVLFLAVQSAVIGTSTITFDPETGTYETTGGGSFLAGLVLAALFGALYFVVAAVLGSLLVRAALDITDGKELDVAAIFRFDKVVPVLIASLIIGAATFVGTLLCYLPGLVVAFLTQYTLFFLLDKDLEPMAAIRASFEFVKANFANVLVWYIIAALVGGAGAIVCGIGLLVTVPIVIIGTAYTYRTLNGMPVAA